MVGTRPSQATRNDFLMSSGEIICLVTMVYSSALAFPPIRIFSVAGSSAWVSMVLAGLLGAVLMVMWVRLTTLFPDKILPQFVETIMGIPLGKLINFFLLTHFLFVVAGNTRIVAEVMFILMPDTPHLTFIASAIGVAMIVVRLGPEVMGRMSVVIFMQISLGLLLVIGSLVPSFNWIEFIPVMADGFEPIFRASLTPTAFIADILILSFFIPHLSRSAWPKNLDSLFKKVLVIGSLSLALIWSFPAVMLFLEQGVIGPEGMSRVSIPGLTLVRNIAIGTFFERLEAGLVAIWLPAILMKIMVFLYAGSVMAQHVAGSRSYRFYVVPLGVVAAPMAYSMASTLPKLISMLNGTMSLATLLFHVTLLIVLLLVGFVRRSWHEG